MQVSIPVWLEGSLGGLLLAMIVVPFIAISIRSFSRKQAAEGSLAAETLKQLQERNAALSQERADNATEIRAMREAHAAEIRSERDNASALQTRVLDLSAQMVKQAQDNANQVVSAVEQVRHENREGLAALSKKLETAESLHHECERRHMERDREAEVRRQADEARNAERDSRISELVELVGDLKEKR